MSIERIEELTGKTIQRAEHIKENPSSTLIRLYFTDGESISIVFWDSDGFWDSPAGKVNT